MQWDIYIISYSSYEIKFCFTIVIQFEENNTQYIPNSQINYLKKEENDWNNSKILNSD